LGESLDSVGDRRSHAATWGGRRSDAERLEATSGQWRTLAVLIAVLHDRGAEPVATAHPTRKGAAHAGGRAIAIRRARLSASSGVTLEGDVAVGDRALGISDASGVRLANLLGGIADLPCTAIDVSRALPIALLVSAVASALAVRTQVVRRAVDDLLAHARLVVGAGLRRGSDTSVGVRIASLGRDVIKARLARTAAGGVEPGGRVTSPLVDAGMRIRVAAPGVALALGLAVAISPLVETELAGCGICRRLAVDAACADGIGDVLARADVGRVQCHRQLTTIGCLEALARASQAGRLDAEMREIANASTHDCGRDTDQIFVAIAVHAATLAARTELQPSAARRAGVARGRRRTAVVETVEAGLPIEARGTALTLTAERRRH